MLLSPKSMHKAIISGLIVPVAILLWLLITTSSKPEPSSLPSDRVGPQIPKVANLRPSEMTDPHGLLARKKIACLATGPTYERLFLRGRVVSAKSGAPIAGATIQGSCDLEDESDWKYNEEGWHLEPSILCETTSRKDGTFDLGGLDDEDEFPCSVIIRARGYAITCCFFDPEEKGLPSRRFLIRMVGSRVITGTVVDAANGRTIPGVEVHAIGIGPSVIVGKEGEDDLKSAGVKIRLSTLTDDHGRFRIDEVDPRISWQVTSTGGCRTMPLFYFYHHQGHRKDPKFFRHKKAIPVDLKGTMNLTIRLHREKRARLSLSLPTGHYTGELVTVWTNWFQSDIREGKRIIGRTGSSKWLVQPFPQQPTILDVDNPVHRTYLRALLLDEKGPRYRGVAPAVVSAIKPPVTAIKFCPLARLTGQVVDTTGRPLPNIRIWYKSKCLDWIGSWSFAEFHTNQEGNFVLNELPGENVNIHLSGKGYADRQVTITFPTTYQAETLGLVRLEKAIK